MGNSSVNLFSSIIIGDPGPPGPSPSYGTDAGMYIGSPTGLTQPNVDSQSMHERCN